MRTETEIPLEVFFGEATPFAARVYVRAEYEHAADARLTGSVLGPHSTIARTLPARLRLHDLGVDRQVDRPPARLAEAILPDPCFWLPQRPYWYDVHMALDRGKTSIVVAQRKVGIRPLGVRGTDLFLDGHRWVMRGAIARTGDRPLAQAACRGELCLMIRDPSDALLEEASGLGVLLVVVFDADRENDVMAELHRLAQWPAVAMARLPATAEPGRWPGRPPRNLLIAQYFGPGDPVRVESWAEVVVVEDHDTSLLAERMAGIRVPAVALWRDGTPDHLRTVRRHCDRLQRALAAHGDFAGYFVGPRDILGPPVRHEEFPL